VIRLGRISYVNMAPLFFRLQADVEQVAGVPTELNERLISGDIDLAPISSIAYARNSGELRILSSRARR
jgi:chorismate dehydratase